MSTLNKNLSSEMATVTLAQEHNSYIVYNRQVSTDSGWENPFRPGGDLSREADEIVELIKEGKPITPTPGSTSPKLPTIEDTTDNGKLSPNEMVAAKNVANDLSHSPKTPEAKKVANSNQQSANGNTVNEKAPVGAVEVQRGTVVQPVDASQVEHVIIKKKPKCKCCVIQ